MHLTLEHLSLTYPNGRQALQDLSLELSGPNLIGLLGPNGAGKSTLMKLLVAGLLPTGGSILADNLPLLAQERTYKAKLGYLPQTFGLYQELTVWQFLDYMAALKGVADAKASIRRALEATNLMQRRGARIRTLSGGQRQRVGIAQALLGDPALLIFDEPTVGLDPEERIHFRNCFSQLAQDRLVLLSTHIIEDVQAVCSQLVVLHGGRVRFTGAPTALIQAAQGHVGVFEEQGGPPDPGLHITTRINTARGVSCRVVAQTLPPFAQPVEPTLEDAYLFLISQEAQP